MKRRGLTAEGRKRLRAAALANKPWLFATGPKTAAGKAVCAQNGKLRQAGPISVRRLRADLAEMLAVLRDVQNTVEEMRN